MLALHKAGGYAGPWERESIKRAIDIVLSSTALLVLAPLLVGIGLAIRLDSSGPAIFRQRRVGKHQQLYVCLKFRTMYLNCDENVHVAAIQRLWNGERLSTDLNAPYKLTNDPRVTPLGQWLRRTSLDELPQLINVLKGEMSIVGPRPSMPYELEHITARERSERQKVNPGITGLWQVRGRGCVSFDEMLRLDLEYARTSTLWTDIKLIMLTIPAVVRGRGAR